MLLPRFAYSAPRTLAEASELLAGYGQKAAVIAGGTDLLIKMKERKRVPSYLVGLQSIPGLEGIWENGGRIRIGALTTLDAVARSPALRGRMGFLSLTAGNMATPQIRNMATIGGNLCNAARSADMAPPLLACGASARLSGIDGARAIPLEEFFTGSSPRKTALQGGEILTGIEVPLPAGRWGGAYFKLSLRSRVDISVAGVAAVITLDSKGRCAGCRIFLGGVSSTPLRARPAEEALIGQPADDEVIRRAAAAAAAGCRPTGDIRASGAYRAEMVAVLARRALRQAREEAQAGGGGV